MSIYIYIYIYIYNCSPDTGFDVRSIFKRSLTGLTSVFLLDLLLYKIKEHSLINYLQITRDRVDGFLHAC